MKHKDWATKNTKGHEVFVSFRVFRGPGNFSLTGKILCKIKYCRENLAYCRNYIDGRLDNFFDTFF